MTLGPESSKSQVKKWNSKRGDPEQGKGGAWGMHSQDTEKQENYPAPYNREGVPIIRPERKREHQPRLDRPC